MNGFPILRVAAGFLTLVSAIAIGVGVLLVANASHASFPESTNPFGLAPQLAQFAGPAMIAGGASLILSGLIGAMLSGAVRVLIAIEENMRNAAPKSAISGRSVKDTEVFAESVT